MIRRRSNPFTPTFGSVPYALAGRTELIDDVIEGLANRPGDPNRSTIFIGPRGSGKTVLLRTIEECASEQGWISVNVTAKKGMLDRIITLSEERSAHLVEAKSESSLTSLTMGPLAVSRELRPAHEPWWLTLTHLVEDLNARGIGLMVTIDEIDPTCEELIDFICTYQQFVSEGRDVALLMSGLPNRVMSLFLDKSASFIRRAFQRYLTPISQIEVEEALLDTIVANGRQIDNEALAMVAEATDGFAFAIQLMGYYLWRASSGRELIGVDDAREAIRLSERELVHAIIEPALRELTARELEYLEAMACDVGQSVTSEVAKRMGVSMSNASNLRRRLINHGLIEEVRMGVVTFSMPLLAAYLRENAG